MAMVGMCLGEAFVVVVGVAVVVVVAVVVLKSEKKPVGHLFDQS